MENTHTRPVLDMASNNSDEEQSGLLSNFIFGNIDEDGRLETDFIDDVSLVQLFVSSWTYEAKSFLRSPGGIIIM